MAPLFRASARATGGDERSLMSLSRPSYQPAEDWMVTTESTEEGGRYEIRSQFPGSCARFGQLELELEVELERRPASKAEDSSPPAPAAAPPGLEQLSPARHNR